VKKQGQSVSLLFNRSLNTSSFNQNYMRIFIALLFAIVLISGCKPKHQKLPSGYEYVLHTHSTDIKAEPGSLVYVEFYLRNDDSVVISSKGQPMDPITLPDTTKLQRPLAPAEEALFYMRKGDSLTVIISLDTVPVERRPQGFQKSKFLYYDIVLKDVVSKKSLDEKFNKVEAKIKGYLDQYKKGSLANIKTTASGLKYVVHEEGSGPLPDSTALVFVDYYGCTLDGKMFDNSYQRGSAFKFPLGAGAVIPGWDEGVALLKPGSKATFFIPGKLAYGEQGVPGAIPPNAELMFYVELKKVEHPPRPMMPPSSGGNQ
jgi:FKBP-type peptidyl-prolyl cis-trans isomerase FkpA